MSSAVQELLTILSAPPSANAPTSQSTYHVNLQSLRDAGDKSFLFLRSILELTSNSAALQQNPQHSAAEGQQQELAASWLASWNDLTPAPV